MNDQMTLYTFQLIEWFCKFSHKEYGFSKTTGVFIDKIGFYTEVAKIVSEAGTKESSKPLSGSGSQVFVGKHTSFNDMT